MRVAYYSPLPPERSGIADYSALLLPALHRRIEVDAVRRPARRRPRGDVALYQVGNNPEAHGWILEALKERKGVAVLHDFVLHHLVAGATLGVGNRLGYLEALYRDSGVVGRLLGHGVIDGLVPPLWEERPHDFPLASSVLDHVSGLIVHSRYVERRVRETGYYERLWRIPMPAWSSPPPAGPRELPESRSLTIGCFGHINFSKRVPQLLEAFARLRERHPDALLVLAGSISPRLDGVSFDAEGVIRLDYLDESHLWQLLHECDVSVNLRYPTMGETSAMVIRAFSVGTPVVVTDVDSFSELPEAVALKVPHGPGEVDALTAVLETLAAEPERRAAMGAAALELARTEHDLEHVAELYTAALEEAAGGDAVERAVVDEVARAAQDVGLRPQDEVLAELGASLRESGLGR
jgi:glycosyltransferase involved in cell wall biosynthesis